MDAVDQMRRLARYNAWANGRLHAACVALAPGDFGAPRTGFFPSLRATLNHILITDWYYLDLVEQGGLGRATQRVEIPFPDAPALLSARIDADRRLIAFCDRLTPAGLLATRRKDTDGVDTDEIVQALLTHLFVHQIHHRGQAHAMLAGTSVAPPQLDEFFLLVDTGTRERELTLLGIGAPPTVAPGP